MRKLLTTRAAQVAAKDSDYDIIVCEDTNDMTVALRIKRASTGLSGRILTPGGQYARRADLCA